MSPDVSPGVRGILDALRSAGVTHVVGLPDNTSAPLFDALSVPHPEPGQAYGEGDSERRPPHLVTVTREGEAFALASGLWLGGGSPMVVVQNTGLLESGDALRGTAGRMGVPLPFVVTGRGWSKMLRAGVESGASLNTREGGALLVRPDVDSVALLTEPTLRAWGIPFLRCDDPAEAPSLLAETADRAHREERPTALLVTGGLG